MLRIFPIDELMMIPLKLTILLFIISLMPALRVELDLHIGVAMQVSRRKLLLLSYFIAPAIWRGPLKFHFF